MTIIDTIMAWFGAITGIMIAILIGLLILGIILQILFLMIGIKAVGGTNRKFGPVFVTTLLNALCMLLPCIGCFLAWLVISKRHNVSYGKGFLAWLISIIVPAAISIGLSLLFSFLGWLTLPI